MNDEGRDQAREESGSPTDEETGEPVYALRALAVEPRPGFLSGIRNRIHRGVLAGDLADFSWRSWAEALLQYLAMIFAILSPSRDSSEER